MNVNLKSEFPVKKIGIIGEGKMGSGILNYLIDYPFELVWLVSKHADVAKINKQFAKKIHRSRQSGTITQFRYDQLVETPVSQNCSDLATCDMVIEAISENRELKAALFLELDSIIKPEALFLTNTSSILPSEISPGGSRKRLFAGLHFFYPLQFVDITEITITDLTSDTTIELITSFLELINRNYLLTDEKNCFPLNRVFLDFQNEAYKIVKSGKCTYFQMDQLVKTNFFPFGVFDFCDSVGIDTMLSSVCNYTRNYDNKIDYEQFIQELKLLNDQNKLGIKNQEGFYSYHGKPVNDSAAFVDKDIIDFLRRSWVNSVHKYLSTSNIPDNKIAHAVKEYFGMDYSIF